MVEWNFQAVLANSDLLLLGLLNTLKVTGLALLFGVPLGLALALLRLSTARPLSGASAFVIEFFRTTPPPPAAGGAEEVRRRKDRDSDPRLMTPGDLRLAGGDSLDAMCEHTFLHMRQGLASVMAALPDD